ncbi:MAG: Flp pilus assembly complex ATPase component TadA [Gemmatimonadetes bacterium]|nr:Flp pilus assembly complex ATPase component TadA [Gemmatimonadota bacterium]
MEPGPRVLGQLLLSAGAVREAELAAALAEQRRTRERLGEVLARRGVDPEQVARALAAQLRLGYAEPPLDPEPAAVRLVDRSLALRLRIVPLAASERRLRVAMADPLDAAAVDDLQFQTGRRVEPLVAAPATVEQALAAAYGPEAVATLVGRIPTRAALPRGVEGAQELDELSALRHASEAPPIIGLVDLILSRAAAGRASDIHIEPSGRGLRVRARVDGVLRELLQLPEHVGGAVTSRIKIMAGLDIAVKRRPQDGRSFVRVDGRELGVRVSTLPAEGGEKVVLRLLDPANAGRRLDELGMAPATLARFHRLLGRGHGVLLVCGPTGSGKTTTLYAALGALDRERRNVITLEDPVEYRLPGLTQVQVHTRAGLTFAAALRAVLRQDPDVIMVGELRDGETVEVGMAAALTGHLVLATLHTNDAPGAVARLVEMGAPPYLIAGGLIGVLAQRLARRLCPQCRVERDAEPGELRGLGLPPAAGRLPVARGCSRCDGEGFRGRTGIFELLVLDARLRQLVLRRAAADALRDAARAAGMEPLSHDAWQKVRAGIITLDEVRPLLTLMADEAPLCPDCGTGLRAGFAACPGCGRNLRRRCRCGAALEEGWRCCAACAAPVDTAMPAAPPAGFSAPAAPPTGNLDHFNVD